MADDEKPKLWVAPPGFNILKMRPVERTVTYKGERAKLTIDDSGTVMQIERPEHLDAVARPATVRRKVTRQEAMAIASALARRG